MHDALATLLPALAQALLHFLWQGVLIGAGAALALRALRGARPQARYAVACAALLACLIAPIATLFAQLAPSLPAAVGGLSLDAPRVTAFAPEGLLGVSQLTASPPWIVLLWALGACAVAARMALGLIWIRGLSAIADEALAESWQRQLDALARRFDLRRRVTLRIVDGLDTPAAFGGWRPVVLLPAALLTRLPTELIEALLAHELAHIRRHDYLVNLAQVVVEALLFYHPVVWWLSHRIRIEREEVADRLAADCACPPRRLACALSALSELQAEHGAPRLAQAARGGSLFGRVERLLGPAPRARPGARLALAFAGLAAASIASLAYAQATRSAGPPEYSESELVAPRQATRDTYVLVHKGRALAWGPRDSADAEALALGLAGDFFFAHRAGMFYVVTDPALVERASGPWREFVRVERELEALDVAYRNTLEAQGGSAHEAQEANALQRALGLRSERLHRVQNRTDERIERESRGVLDTALIRGTARPTILRVASLR